MADLSRTEAADRGGRASVLAAVVRRRWPLIAVWTIGGSAIALWGILHMPPRYRAEAVLILSTRTEHLSDLKSVVSGPLPAIPDPNVARSEVEVLRGRVLAEQVVRRLDLEDSPDLAPRVSLIRRTLGQLKALAGLPGASPAATTAEERMAQAVDGYLQRFSAFNDGRSFTLSLSYTSADPELAARVANTHAELYLADQRMLKRRAGERATAWLTHEIARLHGELQQQQAAIRDQRERAGLVGSSGSTELERQVADLGISLAQARADVAMRRARVVATRAGGSASQPVLDSDLIHKLREQEAQAQQRVAGLGQQHGSAYPEYAAARSQAADISAKIDQETARILRGLQTDFVTAQQREADLVAALGTLQHQREAQARAAADVDNLEHDAQATQTVYQTLLTSLSQIQAQLGAEDADARVISAASPPRLPYFPNVPVFASIALIVSSATGVALAWLLESRQRGITRLDELQDLELTALEPIPYVSARERRGRRLGDMLLAEPKSVLAEQVRALRGDLARSKGARVFALVSALPAEGKTATALLLGRSMAASGLHVLVVECDLRRPSAMRQLGLAPTRPGLVGVLRDGAPFSAAAVEDHDSPLHLLAPEEDVARPQDLLAGDALRRLLDTARAQYDYVLIDTPPLGAVSDALLVASQADCTLLVVRWKTTPVVAVRAVLRKLARHDLQVAGAVLNATNLKRSVPDGLASLYRAGRAYARGTHTV